MQTIGPTATFHHTTRLLIDNLDLVIVNDIVHVFLKEGVCFQQLVYGVYAFGLHAVVSQNLIFLLAFLFVAQSCLLHFSHFATHIWEYEELGIFHVACERINTLVGEFDSLMFLINHEIELVGSDMHMLLVFLHIELFGLLQAYFHTRLAQVFDQRFALWHTFECAEECQLASFFFFLISTTHLGFGFGEEFGGKCVLSAYQQLHTMLILVVHLILSFRHRTTDNQRCTCIVNQYRVHLVHDSVVMSALYEVHRAGSHIIAQVVEAKLVIRTKCNIARICTATLIRVWFVFVDTIHGQAMEHIERTHPLRVTFSQVVVHCHHVYALVGHSIEEDWQGSHKGFTLTRSHLGYLAFVEYDTTNELHIIVHHVPHVLIAASCPFVKINRLIAIYLHEVKATISCQVTVHLSSSNNNLLVLGKTTSSALHNGKYLWQYLTQYILVSNLDIFFDMVNLVIYFLTFINREFFDIGFQFCNACFLVSHALLNTLHQGGTACTKGIIVQSVNLIEDNFDFLYIRHNLAHIFLRLVAE